MCLQFSPWLLAPHHGVLNWPLEPAIAQEPTELIGASPASVNGVDVRKVRSPRNRQCSIVESGPCSVAHANSLHRQSIRKTLKLNVGASRDSTAIERIDTGPPCSSLRTSLIVRSSVVTHPRWVQKG